MLVGYPLMHYFISCPAMDRVRCMVTLLFAGSIPAHRANQATLGSDLDGRQAGRRNAAHLLFFKLFQKKEK